MSLQPVLSDVAWAGRCRFPRTRPRGRAAGRIRDAFLLLAGDGALDGDSLCALDDGGDDRAADEIAAVKDISLSAAQGDFQEFVLIAMGELQVDDGIHQRIDGRGNAAGSLHERGIVREAGSEIDFVNIARSHPWWDG